MIWLISTHGDSDNILTIKSLIVFNLEGIRQKYRKENDKKRNLYRVRVTMGESESGWGTEGQRRQPIVKGVISSVCIEKSGVIMSGWWT